MVIARSFSSRRVFGSTIRAAAGRDDPDVPVDQPGDEPSLAVAETRLAITFEHLRRAGAPAASSISSSLSTKAKPSRFASRRPTVDLPTPIRPDQHHRAIEKVFAEPYT